MYSFYSRVRYSEVGQDKRLRTDALINYFQDCSTFQSEDLGVGLSWLGNRGRCWIVNSWQVKIWRFPELGEEIQISTWPNSLKGVLGTRNFQMSDKEGRILAVANSLWTYFDVEHLKPAKIDEEIIQTYVMEPAFETEWEGRKIALPEGMTGLENVPVQLSHLDTNHHVNNGQYIQMALGYLPEDFQVTGLRVEYKKAAVYGDVIHPYIYKKKDCFMVSLADESGSPYAVVEFKTFWDKERGRLCYK